MHVIFHKWIYTGQPITANGKGDQALSARVNISALCCIMEENLAHFHFAQIT